MSDTPRTDEAVRRNLVETTIWAVPIDFARQLERELAGLDKDYGILLAKHAGLGQELIAARAATDRMRGALGELKKWTDALVLGCCDAKEIRQSYAELDAASTRAGKILHEAAKRALAEGGA